MAIAFPSSPTIGQTFTVNTKTWQWDGTSWNSISGTANAATNIVGGAAGQVHYQSATNTTAFTAAGTAGQVLTSNGTSAPTWSSVDAMPQIFMMMGS